MATTLINSANFSGTLDEQFLTFASNQVSTNTLSVANNFTETEEGEQPCWISGCLQYSICVANDTGKSFNNVTMTDTIDISIAKFDFTYGVAVNGTQLSQVNYEYDRVSGLLTVALPNMPTNTMADVTFQVVKI
ncbi:MAG: hypothetical protein LBU60_05775 [Clostridiales bacterium]|jgi:preprotein translocase subunit Sec63|nr:hypothetical protein [Clostridiales bacterium]